MAASPPPQAFSGRRTLHRTPTSPAFEMSIPISYDWKCTFYVPFQDLENVEIEFGNAAHKHNTFGSNGQSLASEWSFELLEPSRSAKSKGGPETKKMAIVVHTIRFSHKANLQGSYLKVRSEHERLFERIQEVKLKASVKAIPGFVFHQLFVSDAANVGKDQIVTYIQGKSQTLEPSDFSKMNDYLDKDRKFWRISFVHRPVAVGLLQLFGQHEWAGIRERARCVAALQKVKAAVETVLVNPDKGYKAARKSLEQLSSQNREMMKVLAKTFSSVLLNKIDKEIDPHGESVPGLSLTPIHESEQTRIGDKLAREQVSEETDEEALAEKQLEEDVSAYRARWLEFHRAYRTLQHDVSDVNACLAGLWNYVHMLSHSGDIRHKLRNLKDECNDDDLQLFLQQNWGEFRLFGPASTGKESKGVAESSLTSSGESMLRDLMRRQERLYSGVDSVLSRGSKMSGETWKLTRRLKGQEN